MIINPEQAHALKLAMKSLTETPHGLCLLEFLDDIGGKYAPTYDTVNPTDNAVIRAAGRTEVIQTLRNIERLSVEQIVTIYKGA